ncbi:C-type lectin domain family 10 member A-like [Aplysia californica]|uniref:C-type lectin domain family 10 member A-like n=1 Tax=Aplysia californica TaxID=6500 RepID=A0ABM0JWI8_APLCA|nr:C-type lectin domain family 10 member A-like [Aplysia californica]
MEMAVNVESNSIQWTYPANQVAGLYKCEAYGISHSGHPHNISAGVAIMRTAVSTDMIVTKMKQMEIKLKDLSTRVENSKGAITLASTNYRGHHYFVSEQLWGNVFEANRLCQLYGGYLVEINDRQEFDFLIDFLNKHTYLERVWVGATDKHHEGTWTFMTSGGYMTTFAWQDQEPSGGSSENCMSLHIGDKEMSDVHCYQPHPWQMNALLCEIPDGGL